MTIQWNDKSVANMIASGLFSDGCGCALIVGDQHPLAEKPGLTYRDSNSVFFRNSENVMGWDVRDEGFRIQLDGEVPRYAKVAASDHLQSFLHRNRVELSDIRHFIAHPGGPKVLMALEEGIGIKGQLKDSWQSLKERGNMSSVSFLHILEKKLENESLSGMNVTMALGPAFSAEMGLFEWA